MTIDEWRARESTASQLGVTDEALTVMTQPVEQAQILVLEDMAFDANRIVDAMGRDQNAVMLLPVEWMLKEIAVKDFV